MASTTVTAARRPSFEDFIDRGIVDTNYRPCGLSVAFVARMVTFSSSFSEGWEYAIFGLVVLPVSKEFGLTSLEVGLLASVPLLMSAIGSLAVSVFMDWAGRRPAIIISYVLCALGSFCMATAPSILFFGLGRSITVAGIKSGATSVTVYMTELSPADHRGILVSIEEIWISFGAFVATLVAWLTMGRGILTWRTFVALGLISPISAMFLFLMLNVPESPRYLQLVGREAEAAAILRAALQDDEVEISKTMELWRQEAAVRRTQGTVMGCFGVVQEFAGLFKHNGFRIAAGCWLCRMASGGLLLRSYFALFLGQGTDDGLDQEEILKWFAAASLVKTLCMIPTCLCLIDSVGRRTLFLVSALGCIVAMAGAGAFELLDYHKRYIAGALICWWASYSVGYGPVPWVYCFEVLPMALRGKAASFSMLTADVFGMLLLTVAPMWFERHSALPMLILVVTNMMAFIFFFVSCKETKGMLLEEAGSDSLSQSVDVRNCSKDEPQSNVGHRPRRRRDPNYAQVLAHRDNGDSSSD